MLEDLTMEFSLEILDAPLRSIEISEIPIDPACDSDVDHLLTVMGVYGDESSGAERRDIASEVTWKSTDPSIAKVLYNEGIGTVFKTFREGQVDITAEQISEDGLLISETFQVNIGERFPKNITFSVFKNISQNFQNLVQVQDVSFKPKGEAWYLKGFKNFSCGDNFDITNSIGSVWSTSNNLSGTISGNYFNVNSGLFGAVGNVTLTHNLTDGSSLVGNISFDLTPHEVKFLRIDNPYPADYVSGSSNPIALERGLTRNYTATVIYTDGYEQDVTSAVDLEDDDPDSTSVHKLSINWVSQNQQVATVTNGTVEALSEGLAPISVRLFIDFHDVNRPDPDKPFTASLTFSNTRFDLEVRSPCPDGIRYGQYCYYVGNAGDSCTQTCGGTIDLIHLDGQGLLDFIATCQHVFRTYLSNGIVVSQFPDSLDIGCAYDVELAIASGNDPNASFYPAQRACACKN